MIAALHTFSADPAYGVIAPLLKNVTEGGQAVVAGDKVMSRGPGDGGGATAGRWSKMSDEPLAREREPIERVRARLEALVRANAAPRCGARTYRAVCGKRATLLDNADRASRKPRCGLELNKRLNVKWPAIRAWGQYHSRILDRWAANTGR